MANVIVGQLLHNGMLWGAACSTLFAIPEYVRWGKAAPPSKSPWFWVASEDDHSTNQRAFQTAENHISSLLQGTPAVTITVPTTITTTKKDVTTVTTTQKEPTTTVTGTGEPITVTTTKKTIKNLIYTSWLTTTTTSKTTRTSYTPSTTLTELKTITLYRTNTQTYYQHPSISTVTKHTEITTTSKIRPTFTKTATEITAPTQTIYSDSASPAANTSDWLKILIPACIAIIAVAYGAYKYGASESRKKIEGNWIETERKQRIIAEEHDQMLEDREFIELEKEQMRQQKAQIEKDAEAKIVDASVDLKAHKGMLERLKAAIKTLDGFEVTDSQLQDDETFESGLARWKHKRRKVAEADRDQWRTKERQNEQKLHGANLEIARQKRRVKQMEDILTAVGNENNVDFGLQTYNSMVRETLDTQTKLIAELSADVFELDRQNDTIRARNVELQRIAEEADHEAKELVAELSQYKTGSVDS